MKSPLFIAVIMTMFISCQKDSYRKFSSEDLDFVNYNEGQTIKFIDTNSNSRTLIQSAYKKDFKEEIGMFSVGRTFYETYQISYLTQIGNPPIGLSITVLQTDHSIDIDFFGYKVHASIILLSPSRDPILINGVSYNDVYTLKVYNNQVTGATNYGRNIATNNQYLPNTDTATLYHNKQYGIIQLLFPKGKRILRSN